MIAKVTRLFIHIQGVTKLLLLLSILTSLMDTGSIIQWNCRGLLTNFDDINDMADKHHAICISLQETYLHTQDLCQFRRWNISRKDRTDAARTSGGVAVLTEKSLPVRTIPLRTNLEAVAVQISASRLVTVCSLYLPPSMTVEERELDDLVRQLPQPFLLLGDFNAHNRLWGSGRTDRRGRIVENVLSSNVICLLNTGAPTHINFANQSFSAIDLSLCSPSIFHIATWEVEENPYGSDHFPAVMRLQSATNNLLTRPPKWKLACADWNSFATHADLTSLSFHGLGVEQACKAATDIIINAATCAIPQTSGRLPRCPKPWWTSECAQTRREQNRAWGILRRYPTPSNLLAFKRARAKARWTRRRAQQTSWRNFVSSLNSTTSSKKIWDRLRKIKGDYRGYSIPMLCINGTPCADLNEQANALAGHFRDVSSSLQYTREFLNIKKAEEKKVLRSNINDPHPYNSAFGMTELLRVLSLSSRDTAPGPDRVTYSMLRHLSRASHEKLLELFNLVWREGHLPAIWKTATIIPVLKPDKGGSDPGDYRPIALTSCLGKTFERLVNTRLVHYLEETGCLSKYQCGFRMGCSTVDHLVRLETTIREAFIKKQHCVSVFFDLRKAYDTTWRYGILRDLHSFGIRGRLFLCVSDFLQGRSFKVQLGRTLSHPFIQENGVPQGSVLSVTLFIVKMNSIVNTIPPSIVFSLYVDDIQISCCSKNIGTCERQLQLTIHKLSKWALENGFNFSPEKTVCVPFSRSRGMAPDPVLKMNGHDIATKSEHKFLGLLLDKKLSFSSHIKNLKVKCTKSLNLLKVLAHRSWGADRNTLYRVYISCIRSRLDYGCFVYGSARPSMLKHLDPVHHQGLRLVLGAFRTSPVQSLYVESNEWSLEMRRFYLGTSYALRVRSYPQHPALPCVQSTRYRQLFLSKPNSIKPFCMRAEGSTELFGFSEHNIPLSECGKRVPPWQPPISYNCSLTKYNKRETPTIMLRQEFESLKESFGNHVAIYTDGSKTNKAVSCAVVSDTCTKSHRLRSVTTIFSAEMYAIVVAINYILQNHFKTSVIYTDSLSCLQALCSLHKPKNFLVQRAQYLASRVINKGNSLTVCWVPSHVGIPGNESADRAATAALTSADITPFDIPHQDLRTVLKNAIHKHWLKFWKTQEENKLHRIKPQIGIPPVDQKSRLHEVLSSRLRIGHTFLTHGFLLRGEEPPQCSHCGEQISIMHILISCPLYERDRRHNFHEFYRYHLPFHPALLLGDEPLVPFERVLSFLSSTVGLNDI